jgi:hypothetical protein
VFEKVASAALLAFSVAGVLSPPPHSRGGQFIFITEWERRSNYFNILAFACTLVPTVSALLFKVPVVGNDEFGRVFLTFLIA